MLSSARVRRLAFALVASLGLGLVIPTSPAPVGAAGITTHAWMGQTAIELVGDPDLAALLEANPLQVYAGSQFPDSGYIPGNTYGEEAHWQRFHDAYAQRILARTDCGDLTAPNGPCAAQIAHLMGAIAHGMGDQVWDWLYEPYMAQYDEYFYDPLFGSFADAESSELVLDLVAIGLYGRVNPDLPPLPSKPDLIAAFADAGLSGVTEAQLDTGLAASGVIGDVEELWAGQVGDEAIAAMPWLSNNMVDGPGGVDFAAIAIAEAWDSMWGQLLGEQPATVVSNTHPADGERRVAATGWTSSGAFNAGSRRGTAGTDVRIAATLSYAVPYDRPGGPPVTERLPAGAMTLTEVDSGDPVALLNGYPKSVPYGPSSGHHMIAIQPAGDLTPCTWYEVAVTDALLDANGDPVTPFSWQFRTGADGERRRCADDPFTADERYIRAAYQDLLARTADATGLEGWTAKFDRGLTPEVFTASLIGSGEHRNKLVNDAYLAYLGRPAEPAGRAFWAQQARTRPLTAMRAGILASNEVFAAGGGTDAGYVDRLYQLVLGRAPDGPGAQFWTAELDRGVPRWTLSRRLLLAEETVRRTVRLTVTALLDRAPTAQEYSIWVPRVRAADERPLAKSIIQSFVYIELAQAD